MELSQENKLNQWILSHFGQENFNPSWDRLKPIFRPFQEKCLFYKTKIVTVAGTNGKGEVSIGLAHSLNSMGKLTALWSSPHQVSVRERIKVGKSLITVQEMQKTCLRVQEKLLLDRITVSYYEFLFLVFLTYVFSLKEIPKFLVLEVGLGGRLDAVNYLDPNWALVTSISRDHEAILGKGFANILGEKLGITRSHVPLLTSLELSYLQKQVLSHCQKQKIPWKDLFQLGVVTRKNTYPERNRALIEETLKKIIEDENISLPQADLKTILTKLPARYTLMKRKNRTVLFVGAHNIDSMRKLVQLVSLGELKNFQADKIDNLLVSFSERPNVEIFTMLKVLKTLPPVVKRILVCRFEHQKAFRWKKVRELNGGPNIGKGIPVSWEEDWKKLFLPSQEKSNILVAGSYYFCGEVQKFLQELPEK